MSEPKSAEAIIVDVANQPDVNFRKLAKTGLGEILISRGKLTPDKLQEALALQKDHKGKKLGEILIENEFVTSEDMLRALAVQLDLPFYDRLPVNDIDPSLVEELNIQFCL